MQRDKDEKPLLFAIGKADVLATLRKGGVSPMDTRLASAFIKHCKTEMEQSLPLMIRVPCTSSFRCRQIPKHRLAFKR